MMCYRDMTFCPFWESCKDSAGCSRPLTEDVKARAAMWWGGDNAPIAVFGERPKCHNPTDEKPE